MSLKEYDQHLCLAAKAGHLSVAEMMLKLGANPNAQQDDCQCDYCDQWHKEGSTPVILAYHNQPMLELLLQYGASLELDNENGYTPLMMALGMGNLAAVKLLLDLGANVNGQNRHEQTGLMRVSEYGDLEAVKLLLHSGAAVNLTDHEGSTALMVAAKWKCLDIAECLMKHGADTKIVDHSGRTAFDILQESDCGKARIKEWQEAEIRGRQEVLNRLAGNPNLANDLIIL